MRGLQRWVVTVINYWYCSKARTLSFYLSLSLSFFFLSLSIYLSISRMVIFHIILICSSIYIYLSMYLSCIFYLSDTCFPQLPPRGYCGSSEDLILSIHFTLHKQHSSHPILAHFFSHKHSKNVSSYFKEGGLPQAPTTSKLLLNHLSCHIVFS